jgi:hypothetical protein
MYTQVHTGTHKYTHTYTHTHTSDAVTTEHYTGTQDDIHDTTYNIAVPLHQTGTSFCD